jgi:beta-lactamase class A
VTAVADSEAALNAFAREPGRSVWLDVTTPAARWQSGVAPDAVRPAASLLKLALAMAVEAELGDRLDDMSVRVGDVLGNGSDSSVLHVLRPDLRLSAGDLLGLMVSASDGPSARWHLEQIGLDAVTEALESSGCTRTVATVQDIEGEVSLAGSTTARDAVRLLLAATDAAAFPLTAHALASSIRNSRIPLGVTDVDVRIAHKTGTLPGVAHDVALIEAVDGRVAMAFLTEEQHDTLVTGYEMGQCARAVLEAWGLAARHTTSAIVST